MNRPRIIAAVAGTAMIVAGVALAVLPGILEQRADARTRERAAAIVDDFEHHNLGPTATAAVTVPASTEAGTPATATPTTAPAAPTSAMPAVPVTTRTAPDPKATAAPVLGVVTAPAIDLKYPIEAGVTKPVLAEAAGHAGAPLDAGPGHAMTLFGHRTSHGAPFHNIGRLKAGDTITITLADGTVRTFTVTSVDVVPNTEVWLLDDVRPVTADSTTLRLVTCAHADGSPGGTSHRIAVTATTAA